MPTQPIIAVVDDDTAVRSAIDSLLRSHGYVVRTFASAVDFLQSHDRRSAACVISNVRMPGMSGIELQQVLIDSQCPIPMIFVTAFPGDIAQREATERGAICFLSKPFDGPSLIECVERELLLQDPDTQD